MGALAVMIVKGVAYVLFTVLFELAPALVILLIVYLAFKGGSCGIGCLAVIILILVLIFN
ncbi:MAG: hypothetical protein IKN43_01780 [Selenomonadaceae bacterium]|nr:hypothetical protein [Selenomonadaceae bacterium]